MAMRVGPIDFEVLEPFRRWRLVLDENDYGTAFDITWEDTKRPVFRILGAGMIVGGRAYGGVAGYDGFGRQSGWVEADGERFELSTAGYQGTRDHHWGTRDGVGGPGMYRGMQHPYSGEWVEFDDIGIWGDHVLYNLGDDRKGSGTLRDRVHRMRFEPDTRLLVAGEVDLHFESGEVRTMTFERLGHQIAFLRCGMYGGPNGGTPDGDVWHGMAMGETVSGETYDVTDPEVRRRICGLDQHQPVRAGRRGGLRPGRALRHPVLQDRPGRGDGLLPPRLSLPRRPPPRPSLARGAPGARGQPSASAMRRRTNGTRGLRSSAGMA